MINNSITKLSVKKRLSALTRVTLAIILAFSCLNGKGEPIDSLYHIYTQSSHHQKTSTAKVLADEVNKKGLISTQIPISESMSDKEIEAKVHYCMAEHYFDLDNFETSLEMGMKAYELIDEIKEMSFKSDLMAIIANANFRMGNYDEALKAELKAYQIDKELNDNELISSDLNMLSIIYLAVKHPKPGIHYIEKAIAIERKNKQSNKLASRLAIASELYLLNNEPDKALATIEEAYTLDLNDQRSEKAAIRLVQKAAVLEQMSQLDEAQSVLKKALPTLEKNEFLYSVAMCYSQMGDIANKKGNNKEAQGYYKKALSLSIKCSAPIIEQKAERGLWETMREENPTVALLHLERYATLRDSMYNKIMTARLRLLEEAMPPSELPVDLNGNSRGTRSPLLWSALFLGLMFIVAVGGLFYAWRKTKKALALQRQTQVMRNYFITNITNELQTPLSVIMNAGQQLQEKRRVSADENKQIGNIIVKHGDKMLGLVNQLLDIEKVRSQVDQPELKQGDIVMFTRMLVDNFSDSAQQHMIQLSFTSPLRSLNVVFAPNYLRKIVHNLIANAIKFTPVNGSINVHLEQLEPTKLRIIVSDTGKGIPANEINHIFEPFYQGINGDDSVETVLELTLTNQLVKTLNGTIKVDSKPGEGTSFIIDIPVQPSDSSDIDSKETVQNLAVERISSHHDAKQKPLVFIVENNADVGFFIASHLSDKYNLRFARDGHEAYLNAQELVPELIITNLVMPVMDGKQLIKELRANPSLNHIPIIAMTSRMGEQERMSCIEVGADAVLVKPFNSSEMCLLVDHFIQQRSALREQFAKKSTSDSNDTQMEKISKEDKKFLNKLIDVIYAQMAKDDIDMEHIAAVLSLSRKQLRSRVMEITGLTPVAYVLQVRLNYAKQMIMSEDTSLTTIASKCGFQNLSHFSKAFKNQFKVSPMQFRKSIDNNDLNKT